MIDHDRFEVLGGAVMLGEANDAERATFAEHAATCEECRADAAWIPNVTASIAQAKEAETWRPSVANGIARRIRESRSSRFGATVGALGWAVAVSIAINVAFVSGLSTHVRDAFEPESDTTPFVGSMKIELESPAPRVAAVAPLRHRRATVAVVVRPKPRKHLPNATIAPVSAADGGSGASAVATPTIDDVPDVLAGLDVDGSGSADARHVAVQPRCLAAPDPTAPDAATTDATPAPCASAQELQH